MKTIQIEKLIADERVCRNIAYFAKKVHSVYRYSLEYEDAKQMMILQLIEKLPKTIDDSENIYWIVRSILYSFSGSLIQDRGNKTRKHWNLCVQIDNTFFDSVIDSRYENSINRKILLDEIETLLETIRNKMKQNEIAYSAFKLIRKGYTYKEISRKLNLKESYIRKSMFEVSKQIRKLYDRNTQLVSLTQP